MLFFAPRPLRLAVLLLPLLALSLEAATNALPRWREHFPAVEAFQADSEIELFDRESPQDSVPEPAIDTDYLARAQALLTHFHLHPTETFVFDRIVGPETPFPDHHPLRIIAGLRTYLARVALRHGDYTLAYQLVTQNLAQARATLRAQEGILPYIHGAAIWQSTLDGVHAFARTPTGEVPEALLRALLHELLADSGLAQTAIRRALIGEYEHVYRVIVERMPATDDPDLFLSAVSTLGMAPPEPLSPGELGLGITEHLILDAPAALEDFQALIRPYLDAIDASARLPRDLQHVHSGPLLARHRAELGAFYTYATGWLEITVPNLALARAAMESTPNPGGKLLTVFLASPWEIIVTNMLRREAQRSAVCALLAWRIHGGPTTWEVLVAKGLLPSAPADPFSEGVLHYELAPRPRVWSVFLNAKNDGGQLENANSGLPDDLVWLH